MKKNKNIPAQKLDAFDSVNIQITGADCTVKRDDENPWTLSASSQNVEAKVENEQLSITGTDLDGDSIILTVAGEKALSQIQANLTKGDLTCKGIQVETLDVQTHKGDLKIRRSSIQDGKVSLTNGDLDIENSTVGELTVVLSQEKKAKEKKKKKNKDK